MSLNWYITLLGDIIWIVSLILLLLERLGQVDVENLLTTDVRTLLKAIKK